MRARLAIQVAGVQVDLREVVLRDKPVEFLKASPSATVPCLKLADRVIDESFDIMLWALESHDPEHWLAMPGLGFDLVAECDGSFKAALDRYKYASRHEDVDIAAELHLAGLFLLKLDGMLGDRAWLFGNSPSLADMATLPFIRQFAHVDPGWFGQQPWHNVVAWLDRFKSSDRFVAIMRKYPQWRAGDPVTVFPGSV